MLNENIRQMRKSKGITQEEMAIKLGVVRQTISKWEKGTSVPDSKMLIEIADYFETSVAVLLGEAISTDEQGTSIEELSEKLSQINIELAKEKERKRKAIKALSIIGIICVIAYAIFKTAMYFHLISLTNNADVAGAIIGGADGPTAIFVTTAGINLKATIIATIIFIASIIGVIASHKKR